MCREQICGWNKYFIAHENSVIVLTRHGNKNIRGFTENIRGFSPLSPPLAPPLPLFISLHWLLVAARINFKTLIIAYRTATGSAPSYFHSLITIYIPSRSLRSAGKHRLVMPSQRGTKSLSRTFSFTVPSWWNEFPTTIRKAEYLTIFKRHLKTHLFRHHLTSS